MNVHVLNFDVVHKLVKCTHSCALLYSFKGALRRQKNECMHSYHGVGVFLQSMQVACNDLGIIHEWL